MVQRIRLHAYTTEGMGLMSGWGTKIPHILWCGQKLKKKKVEKSSMYQCDRDHATQRGKTCESRREIIDQLVWASLFADEENEARRLTVPLTITHEVSELD